MEGSVAAPIQQNQPSPIPTTPNKLSPKKHRSRVYRSNQHTTPASPTHKQNDKATNENAVSTGTNDSKQNTPENGQSENSTEKLDSRRNRKRDNEINNAAFKKKVIVSGYPPYTSVHEIGRLLSQFGNVTVERSNKAVTVLNYSTEQEAVAAMKANNQIVVYGKFLKIKPYTGQRQVNELSKTAKRTKTKQVPDNIIMPKDIDLEGDFYQQVDNIQAAIRLTAEEIERVSSLYRDVEAVLRPAYPGCRAVPFGSITTGLGIKSSDADCYVEMPARHVYPGHDVRFVTHARRLLAARPDLFTDILAIPGANTPIVKFRHAPTATSCDLNCKTPLGALNSRLVAHLLHVDARLPPLALLVKYWARVHRLSGTGRLTNYALVLMLVFYLQRRRVLPAVASLQGAASAVLVDHWDAGFAPAPRPPADPAPLPDLLGGFFEFYETFDFDKLVVCPYLGEPVPKAAFEGGAAPPGLDRYADNVRRRVACPLRHGSALVVQDPIEQSHNVATGVGPNLAGELREHIAHAAAAVRAARRGGGGGALLPALLLSAPPPRAPPRPPPARVRVPPRFLAALADAAAWRRVLRDLLVRDVFADMLGVRLTPAPAEGAAGNERERVAGAATHAVWARRRYADPHATRAADLVEREARATRRLLADDEQRLEEPLEIELTLAFWETPRALNLTAKMVSGEADAFKALATFMHTVMQNWLQVLVKPHLVRAPAPTDGPASAPAPVGGAEAAAALLRSLDIEDDAAAPASPSAD